jgi:hypothetical protein
MNLAADQIGKTPHCCRKSLGVLFVSSFAGGAVLARLAVWIQGAGFAPLILFPILAGCVIGAAIFLLARQIKACSLPASICASIIAAASFVIFEHLFFYLDYRSGFSAAMGRNPSAAIFAGEVNPIGFFEFLQLGATKETGPLSGWLRWIIDAALTILAAAACVWFTHRQSVRQIVSAGQS